jgi:hypothetical protein
MLRLLVLALAILNLAYLGWSAGLMRSLGLGPVAQSEPQRVDQQLKPEALRVLTPAAFRQVQEQARTDQTPRQCLQAGPLSAEQTDLLRKVLTSATPGLRWQLSALPPRWIIYMGKYSNPELLARKRAEVQALGLSPEAPGVPALEPGISLGGFDSRAQAEAGLSALVRKGLHTAHVVQERENGQWQVLRLPEVRESQKPVLEELRPALAGKLLHSCD